MFQILSPKSKFIVAASMVLSSFLAKGPIYAQSVSGDDLSLISDYVISVKTVSGNGDLRNPCDFANGLDLSNERIRRNVEFDQSVCLYHENEDFIPNDDQDRREMVSKIQSNVNTLQRMQTQGLSSSKQSLAATLEGLSHCQLARLAQPKIETDITQKLDFCESRSSAINALSSINWQYARFGYAQGAKKTIADLIASVGACYKESNGPLSPKYNGFCGKIDNLSPEARGQLIQNTYEAVETQYLGSGGPIAKLFLEKQKIAEGILNTTESQKNSLTESASTLDAAFNGARDYFYANIKDPSRSDSPIDIAVEQYQEAFATAKAILNRYQQWQEALLVKKDAAGNSEDLGQRLVGPSDGPSINDRFQDLTDSYDGARGLSNRVNDMVTAIRKLETSKASDSGSAVELCEIYFCYAAVKNEFDDVFGAACKTNLLFDIQKNPLCPNTNNTLKSDNLSVTPAEHCAELGFDVAKYGRVGLDLEETEGCSQ